MGGVGGSNDGGATATVQVAFSRGRHVTWRKRRHVSDDGRRGGETWVNTVPRERL